MPAPHEWNLSRTASLPQLLPVVRIRDLQRISSVASESFTIRQTRLPLLAHQKPRQRKGYMMERKQSNTMSSSGYILSTDQERQLEEHAKRIELQSISRSQSACESSSIPALKHPDAAVRRRYLLYSFYQKPDPRALSKELPPSPIARSHTTTGSKEFWALTSYSQYPEEKEVPKLAALKRLS
jgi:hypothetical protein